jgi:hypothetical protein
MPVNAEIVSKRRYLLRNNLTSVQIVMEIENKYNIIYTTCNEMIQHTVLTSGVTLKFNAFLNSAFVAVYLYIFHYYLILSEI